MPGETLETGEQVSEPIRVVNASDEGLTPEQIKQRDLLNEERAALQETLADFGENLKTLSPEDLKAFHLLVDELHQKADNAGLIKKPSANTMVSHSETWLSGEQDR